jgi:hypothetical protein
MAENKNPYPGINPHLNSLLQRQGGGWHGFHTHLLVTIADSLNAVFPEYYYAEVETSLQILTYDVDTLPLITNPKNTIADVLVSKKPVPHETIAAGETNTPTLTLPIMTDIEGEEIPGLVIYTKPGHAITRIEVLSPANKPGGSHYGQYLQKRAETLYAGLQLVELDFLHERPPILPNLAAYSRRENGAFPYHVLVTDTRTGITHGKTDVYSFGIMDAAPTIAVPLEGSDSVALDVQAVYNATFSKRPYPDKVDYTRTPHNFETYTELDRQLIIRHMAKIAELP